MICYFQKGLKPFIKVKIKQQDRKFVNFEEMVQKAINIEAKAGLKSTIMVRNLNIRYSQGYCLFNNTTSKVQIQGTTAKDSSCFEKPKTKNFKSVSPYDNIAMPAKKKNKQKRFKYKQKCIKKLEKIPAISNNIVNATKKKKSVTLVKSRISTAIKKATILGTASSQKISIDLSNLCAGD